MTTFRNSPCGQCVLASVHADKNQTQVVWPCRCQIAVEQQGNKQKVETSCCCSKTKFVNTYSNK